MLQTVKEWQARPLESIYPILWLDAIHDKIRENGRVQGHAVDTVPGVNIEGKKVASISLKMRVFASGCKS